MSEADPLRESVLAELRKLVDPPIFTTWCRHLQFMSVGADRYQIPLPNEIYQRWVERQLRAPLEEAFRTATGRPTALDFTTGAVEALIPWPTLLPPPPDPAPPPPPVLPAGPKPARPRLNSQYTFENFIVGPTNRLAYASALDVSETLGRSHHNPLFIHGGVGLGKTHLLQAICHRLGQRYPDADICYLSCEGFVNDYITAVQRREPDAFRNRIRNADILLIDDIHFLSEKEGSQEEFFHTFNALHNANRQIVLSSDSQAQDIPKIKDRLMSRFAMGLQAQIDAPTYEMRVAILRRKAESLGKDIPSDVVDFIANRVTSNIRELEGNINKVIAIASLKAQEIDLPLAKELLGIADSVSYAPVAITEIQQAVCEYFKLKHSDLVSSKRSRAYSLPRQLAMYLARDLTKQSLADIGAMFGNKDHSTVIYSIQKARERIAGDAEFRAAAEKLQTIIQRRIRP